MRDEHFCETKQDGAVVIGNERSAFHTYHAYKFLLLFHLTVSFNLWFKDGNQINDLLIIHQLTYMYHQDCIYKMGFRKYNGVCSVKLPCLPSLFSRDVCLFWSNKGWADKTRVLQIIWDRKLNPTEVGVIYTGVIWALDFAVDYLCGLIID